MIAAPINFSTMFFYTESNLQVLEILFC
jgi:hypothetical protein